MRAGLSATKLAERAGTTASNISRIEGGETPTPRVRLLKKIADVLDLDLADMLSYLGVEFTPSGASDLTTYLRSTMGLPDEAIAEATAAIEQIAAKYRHRQ